MPGRLNTLYDIATEYRDCTVEALLNYKLYLDVQDSMEKQEPEEGFYYKRKKEIDSVLDILDYKS